MIRHRFWNTLRRCHGLKHSRDTCTTGRDTFTLGRDTCTSIGSVTFQSKRQLTSHRILQRIPQAGSSRHLPLISCTPPYLSYVPNRGLSNMAVHSKDFSLDNPTLREYLRNVCDEHQEVVNKMNEPRAKTTAEMNQLHKKLIYLQPLATRIQSFFSKEAELKELQSMDKDVQEDEMADMIKEEKQELREVLELLENEIQTLMVPPERGDDSDIIMEVCAGVGGLEAMLFTEEIFTMYQNYAAFKGWNFEILSYEEGDSGSLRKATALISGENVYQQLKYEGGVHRVQRVPKHIKTKIHTSAMAVAILPQATDIDIQINPEDLEITTCRAGGKGGQHVNTTDSAVRIVHKPTGMVSECQAGRSQIKNKETALNILRSKLFEVELEKQTSSIKSKRKLQLGSKDRSEKIRTYNFQQDRITDHRVSENMYNVESFLQGADMLDDMICNLLEVSRKERFEEILDSFNEEVSDKV